jgi:hypothetical protein
VPPPRPPASRSARSEPTRGRKADRPAEPARSPDEVAAPGWRKVSRGLFWVLFGLFLLLLPGFWEFGKLIGEQRLGEKLPEGEGWVQVDGFVNKGEDAIKLSKREELNVLAYGAPLLLGGLMIILGRLTASSAPQTTGARGLFLWSSLFTLVAVAAVGTHFISLKMGYYELRGYASAAVAGSAVMAELLFLLGLTAVGGTLKRPRVARAAGLFAFGVGVAIPILAEGGGWDAYRRYARPQIPNADWVLFEEAARMVGWLFLIILLWRPVGAARAAAREWLQDYNEAHPEATV